MRTNKNGTIRFLLKRHLYVGVIVFLVAFFLMPFWGLSHLPNEKENILLNADSLSMDANLTRLATSQIFQEAFSLETLTIAMGGLGFLTAVVLMGHLFSRKQCMLQHSLPKKQATDWLHRVVCYLVLCVGAIVLNLFLYLLIVALNGLLPWVNWSWLLAKFGMMLLVNLYGFAIGMLCSVLTGTCWSVLLAGAVLIVGSESFLLLWNGFADSYLHTYASDLSTLLRKISPAYTLYKGLYQPADFLWVPAAIVIPAALILSLVLYRIRKAEAAEHTLAFSPLHTILGLVLPMLGGSIMGVVMQMSFLTEWSLYAGFALGALLTFWVCRILFNQRICGIGKEWYLPVMAALLLCAGGLLFRTDAIGYDHFLPDREQVTAITYCPMQSDTDRQITLARDEALDAAYGWCTLMRDEADRLPAQMYASSLAETNSGVTVTYHMGERAVVRRYPNETARTEAQSQLKCILESQDYYESIIANEIPEDMAFETLHLSMQHFAVDTYTLQNKYGFIPELNGLQRDSSASVIDRHVAAFREDLRQRTYEEKCQAPLFVLYLQGYTSGNEYFSSFMQVYPGDQNLLHSIFGSKAEEIVAYLTGGYAGDEGILVLKTTYTMSLRELDRTIADEKDAIASVQAAATPEEATRWIQASENANYSYLYYKARHDDVCYSRLRMYRTEDVERMSLVYGYEMPTTPMEYISNPMIPCLEFLDYLE